MKENQHLNKAVIYLKLLGVSFYSIQKAFGITDKRNIIRKFNNFKDKYLKEFEEKVNKIKTKNK